MIYTLNHQRLILQFFADRKGILSPAQQKLSEIEGQNQHNIWNILLAGI